MPVPMRPMDNNYYMTMHPLQIQDPGTRFGATSGMGDMDLPPKVDEVDPSNMAGFPRNTKE